MTESGRIQLTDAEREALDMVQALRPVLARVQEERGTENLPETFGLWQLVTDLERYLLAEAALRALGGPRPPSPG